MSATSTTSTTVEGGDKRQGPVRRRAPLLVFLVCVLALAAVAVGLVWVPHQQQVPVPAFDAAAAASVDLAPTSPAPMPTRQPAGVPPGAGPTAGTDAALETRAANADVLDLLADLPVKGRAPKTGYSRGQFQRNESPWTDTDHNRCDTRNDILRRDLDPDALVPGSRCQVATGTLRDPYTGKTITFVRGPDSAAVQIDHVVALSNAWQTGAQGLDKTTRIALANDPLNLEAVDGPTNGAKGDGDAATWLPPNKPARCDYVARQVVVKFRYHLWVTQAEHDTIAGILAGCPDQGLPDGYQK